MQSFDQIIKERKSIRAYDDRPVSREIIEELLDVARWAPSGSNNQPWRVTVATGPRAEALRTHLKEAVQARPRTEKGINATQKRIANGPMAWILDYVDEPIADVLAYGSMTFFGAPVALVWTYPGKSGSATPAAIPAFVTTFMLAAQARGLGTVWLGWPMGEPSILRETLEIPEEEQLAAFVALGYPDTEASINKGRSPRYEPASFTRWLGWD